MFRLLVENLPVGLVRISPAGTVVSANKAAAAMLERGERTIVGAVLSELVESSSRDTLGTIMAAARDGTTASVRRLVFRFAKGPPTFVDAAGAKDGDDTVLVLTDASGQQKAEQQLLVQVTERLMANEAARLLHLEFLVAALRSMPAGVLLVEVPSGQPVLANERFEQLTGGADNVVAAFSGTNTGPTPLEREDGTPYPVKALPLVRAMAGEGSSIVDDVYLRRSNGTLVPLELRAAPVPFEGRSVAILVAQDLGPLRDEVRKRLLAEARYRALFEQSSDAIFIATSDLSKILDANPAAETLLELDWERPFAGGNLGSVVPEDNRGVDQLLRDSLASLSDTSRLVIHGQRKGRPIELDAKLQVLTVPGASELVMVRIRDVTRERELEESLRQSQRVETLGMLAGGIATEFSDLVSTVVGYLELARDEYPGEAGVAAIVGPALDTARQAVEVTRQLLSFSRTSASELGVHDLNAIVSRAAGLIRRLTGRKIAIETTLAPGRVRLECHGAQVEQLIVNLALAMRDETDGKVSKIGISTGYGSADRVPAARGAPDELPLGDASGDLARSPDAEGFPVVSLVSDALDLSDSLRARMFQPFFAPDYGKRASVGFAVVLGIVQRHGARIVASPIEGGGARFSVHFKRSVSPEAS